MRPRSVAHQLGDRGGPIGQAGLEVCEHPIGAALERFGCGSQLHERVSRQSIQPHCPTGMGKVESVGDEPEVDRARAQARTQLAQESFRWRRLVAEAANRHWPSIGSAWFRHRAVLSWREE